VTAPAIQARGVSAAYGPTRALSGLDASVAAGEILVLIGENGSGKSTFLKLVARILEPSSGDLLLDGRPLAAQSRRETARRVAYVPQSVDLVFPIRCLDLVLQGRAPYGRNFSADSAEDRLRALEAMRACDVEALAQRDASALSGGEKRRVFLARALAQQADIWLLDEPTAGLDPRHRLQFLQTLIKVHRERGTTVVFVTHDIDLAAELGDRVLLLVQGRALAEGPPAEVLTPAHLEEAFGVRFEVEGLRFRALSEVPAAAFSEPKP
jgi:iron complex transport system ATP-binding protein